MERLFLAWGVAFALSGIADALHAQVQLVTVPERDAAELTIYGNHNLTFVREKRTVTLRKGLNLIPFSWVGTEIDPTGVQLRLPEKTDGVRLLEAVHPPRRENTVEWRVEADKAGAQALEVAYFIRGLTWMADYAAYVNPQEAKMRLMGNFTLSNFSGEDYESAAARLIAGDIRFFDWSAVEDKKDASDRVRKRAEQLAEEKEEAAKSLAGFGMAAGRLQNATANVVALGTSFSDYYAFALDGKWTLESNWNRKLRASDTAEIPIKVVYRYVPNESNVHRLYTFLNDKAHRLGEEPLPAGDLHVFIIADDGTGEFVGQTSIPFTSVGKELKLDLGAELSVEVEKKVMRLRLLNPVLNDNGDVVRFDTEQEIRFEARNFRSETIRLEIPDTLAGQWEIIESSDPYERKDARTVQFNLDLAPGATKTITYRVRY